LPKKTGITYSTLARMEGDFEKKPGVQMIAKIAKVLGVPM
jgi:transcriptional regulator with XRE-family HTH domain